MVNDSRSTTPSIKRVLILSHKQQQCGVHEFGLNIAEALKKSTRYTFIYSECSSPDEIISITSNVRPDAIIYNYYPSTMPWLKNQIMKKIKIPHIGVLHEVTQQKADEADDSLFLFYIAPDPTLLLKNPIVFKTGRLVPAYNNIFQPPAMPTIGSFGFGTKGKGFERLITLVQQEYDEAHIRLHIPFAAFGDATGKEARAIADRCRKLIFKPGIIITITHDFLNKHQLLDFLAQNTVNAFFYEESKGRGISSVIDLALAVQRPIAITRSDMFRHLFTAYPSIFIEESTLKQIIHNGIEPLLPFSKEWCEENLIWDYERIISEILADASHIYHNREIFSIIRSLHSAFLKKLKGSGRSLPADSWIPKIQADAQLPSIMQRDKYLFTSLPGITTLNRILDNEARLQYKPVIDKLFEIVPDMMSHKLSEANVQQAFVLDTVFRFAHSLSSPKILCIGSYDDTAAVSLKQLGFQMDEVDPILNYDLNTFFHKPTTSKGRYNIILSTSVIEHVKNDELFITQIVELLAPDGVAILTCDYNDQYKPGDKIPNEDFRLYTQNDFKHRFLPLLKNCYLIDEPQWNCPKPDFYYAGCNYTFATLVFKKNSV